MSKLISVSKTIQLGKNCTQDEFNVWTLKYKAIARLEGFVKIMTGEESVPASTATDYDSKLKLNDDGYSHLLLSVTKVIDTTLYITTF